MSLSKTFQGNKYQKIVRKRMIFYVEYLGVDAAAALNDANCEALFLGIEYNASAKSAARFNTISLGNFSGSPGCLGTSLPKRWNP